MTEINAAYEKQLIDSNCNDCKFMVRDSEKFKQSQQKHHDWQLLEFERKKKRLVEKALKYRRENELEKYNDPKTEADRMKFQFNKAEASIQFGSCSKFQRDVSFIPNHCQIETQRCFEHRKQKDTL